VSRTLAIGVAVWLGGVVLLGGEVGVLFGLTFPFAFVWWYGRFR
jgi:hypothetical protein